MSCFHERVGVGWWENWERTGSDNEVLLILFSFSHSHTLMVNVTITKGVACRGNRVASVCFFFFIMVILRE